MKLEQVKQLDFASNASFENIKASISADDMHKLWDMLQNPYKNPIGAVVREYVSNSFDAHAEADFVKNNSLNKIREEYSVYKSISDDEIYSLKEALKDFNNQAVRVTMGKDETGWYWSTEDVGIGLSRERVFNIFANYLKSSKETSNTMIGAFGLGSKSGLSYSDVVFIRTRYLGTESLYLLRKGAEGPEIDVITNEPTDEVNGTEIKIYLNSSDDIYLFQKECREQLSYFDNVFYSGWDVNNNFTIVKGNHWIATTSDTPHYDLHLVLGKVSYPIDWKVLEISPIYLNIGLKFEIGELDVIQTREDVKYTPRTKEAIKQKIELLKEELQERWDNTPKECADVGEYYVKREENPELTFANGKITLDLTNVGIREAGYYYKPFADVGLNETNLPKRFENLFFEYFLSGKFVSRFQKEEYDAGYMFDRYKKVDRALYRIVGDHDPKKSKFILHQRGVSCIYFIRKRGYKHKKLKKVTVGLKWYKDYLNLKKTPKELWRKQITVFRAEMEKYVISQTESYDKVCIDQTWLLSQRKKREARDLTVVKMKKQNIGGYGHGVYETDERNTVASIEQLTRSRIIIGSGMDVFSIRLIHRVYNMFTKAHPSWICSYEVAPTNVKKFKNVKNLTTVESFKEGKTAVFKKVMSTLKLYNKYKKEFEFLERYNSYRSGRETIDAVSPYTKKRLDAFQKIFKDFGNLMRERGNEFLRNECFEIAKEHNLWDFELEKELESCVMLCKSLKIINAFDYVNNNKDPETTKNTLAEFIYFKNRLDPDWVKVPLDIHRTINYNEKYQFCNKKETSINTNVKNILPV